LGKPGFYQRRGQEPNFWMFFQCFKGSSKGTDLPKLQANDQAFAGPSTSQYLDFQGSGRDHKLIGKTEDRID
jgi:hypothetical protein